jgi:hypothetical protein
VLASLVLAGIIAAPVGTVGLLVSGRGPARITGPWASFRRLATAVCGTLLLGAIVVGALRLLGVTERNSITGAAALAAVSLAWLPVTRRWNARGHLCWSSTIFLFVVYLAFVLDWTFASNLGPAGTAGGLLLWLLELFAAVLACAYLWEICDALGSEHWSRRIAQLPRAQVADSDLPFVSLHVPAHNEPPDMVLDTLRSLLRLDYPRFEIIVIDDNSDDDKLWLPVRDQLEPGFLRRCAPLFADSWVGFTQAPQDYRGWSGSRYYRRLFYSYQYFFAVSQPSRNERDGAIFAGTMGLIRRVALEQLGGWDEWCITEDAELSLRLLRAGWSGLHVDQSWGRGIMPLTFEALKGQRYRWCFGGIQILRMHWRSMLPGRQSPENRMSTGQRWSYLTGALQWYGDLLGLVFLVFLLAGAVNLATGGGELFRKLTVFLVATVPVLVLLGLVRAVALLRRGTGASWRDAIGAFFIWQSTSLVVARASVLGLFAKKAALLVTPKTSEQAKWWEALRANWAEATLALFGVLGIGAALSRGAGLAGPLLAGLLVFPTLGMAAAPVNSWAAQRAALPADLREWRTTEWKRSRNRTALVRTVAAGGVAAVVTAVGAVVAPMLAPGSRPVQPPQLLQPAKGQHTQAARPHRGKPTAPASRSATVSPSSPASTSATPTATPTPAPSSAPTATPSPTAAPTSSGPSSSAG